MLCTDLPVWPPSGKIPDDWHHILPHIPWVFQQVEGALRVIQPLQHNLYNHKENTKDQYEGSQLKAYGKI